jgi:4-amino-4-deoxy-L-arabinose transferase-like glycosyltransferase
VTHSGRRSTRATAAVVVCAFVLRAAWSAYAARPPEGLRDPFTYVALARSLAAGQGYIAPFTHTATAYYPPGYPFFIAPLLWLTMHVGSLSSHEPILVALANATCWTAAVYLTIRLARLVTNERAALVAGALVAVWPNSVVGSAVALSEPLFVALVLAGTVVVLEGRTNITVVAR